MLGDERVDVREEALIVIQGIRSSTDTDDQQRRSFRVPNLTGQEASFQDLLRANELLLEPPLTQGKSLANLQEALMAPLQWPYPCHSQGTERMVRAVTEASQHVCGFNRPEGFIRVQQRSRHEMPTFGSKKDFFQ